MYQLVLLSCEKSAASWTVMLHHIRFGLHILQKLDWRSIKDSQWYARVASLDCYSLCQGDIQLKTGVGERSWHSHHTFNWLEDAYILDRHCHILFESLFEWKLSAECSVCKLCWFISINPNHKSWTPKPLQVKRLDELARKMRFFHDQVEKSSVIVGPRTGTSSDALELDELEVIHGSQICQQFLYFPATFIWCPMFWSYTGADIILKQDKIEEILAINLHFLLWSLMARQMWFPASNGAEACHWMFCCEASQSRTKTWMIVRAKYVSFLPT